MFKLFQPIEEGNCATADPELFFLDDNLRGPAKDKQLALAKAVCVDCPVIADCLAFAMKDKDAMRFGVWGGTSPEERMTLLRRERRRR